MKVVRASSSQQTHADTLRRRHCASTQQRGHTVSGRLISCGGGGEGQEEGRVAGSCGRTVTGQCHPEGPYPKGGCGYSILKDCNTFDGHR